MTPKFTVVITRAADGGRATVEHGPHADLMQAISLATLQAGRFGWLPNRVEPGTVDPQTRLEDLGSWSARTGTCLLNENIRTLADLLRRSELDILRIHNMGRRSVEEVVEVLATHGLRLRGS